jgi:8-oxo-dGTP pyrophosphatase MutT (NUDIX family)
VEVPGGRRFDHHVIRFPRASVGCVVVNEDNETLLLWRHRFITDTWAWEIPAGWVDPGEGSDEAIRREVEEETGYRLTQLQSLMEYKPLSGISPMHYTMYLGTNPERVGPPTDPSESTRVEWVPLAEIPKLAAGGQIVDGPSITGLSYYLGVYGAISHRSKSQ